MEVVVEKDEIFGVKDVPKRYYDRVLQKELYFHHRGSTKYLEYADRKIAFLHHFKPSFDNIPELAETLQAIHRIASTSSGTHLILIFPFFHLLERKLIIILSSDHLR